MHREQNGHLPTENQKQLRVAQALFDNDALLRKPVGRYLQRSAALIRAHIKGERFRKQKLGKAIRIALDSKGPLIVHEKQLRAMTVQRAGTFCYTRNFAREVLRDAALTDGKARHVLRNAMRRSQLSGSEITSLLPDDHKIMQILADVVNSPAVGTLCDSLLQECEAHNEIKTISIDGAVKPTFALLGQAAPTASRATQSRQAVPPAAQSHRVLTGRGSTSAVFMCHLAVSEAAEEIRDAANGSLNANQRMQIEYCATDDPSKKLLDELKTVAPNLQGLILDPTHTAFAYEKASGEKKTPRSIFLRKIIRKFSSATGATAKQPLHDGTQVLSRTRGETTMWDKLTTQSMSIRQAKTLRGHLGINKGFENRAEFVEYLAALPVLYLEEMNKKLTSDTTCLQKLCCTAAPARIEWLLNNGRMIACLSASELTLLPIGTASNEALHRQLKDIIFGQSMHGPTLKLKTRIFKTKKRIAHNSALYSPTCTQVDETDLLYRVIGSIDPWPSAAGWKRWCDGRRTGRCGDWSEQHRSAAHALRAWKQGATGQATPRRYTTIKRTVFSQKK